MTTSVDVDPEIIKKNQIKATKVFSDKRRLINENARKEAVEEWPRIKSDPILLSFVALFWAEGTKRSGSTVRITNGDPGIIKVSIIALHKLGIRNLYYYIRAYSEYDKQTCIDKWNESIGFECRKIYINNRRSDKTKIYSKHGVVVLHVENSSLLFHKIMEWLNCWRKDLNVENYIAS